MKFKNVAPLVLTALLVFAPLGFSPAFAASSNRWFHVQVNEGGHDPVEVTVNLPLQLIETALEVLPEDISREVQIELDDAGFTVKELRRLWQEVRQSDDATFVTVKSEDETVEVSKSGDYFLAKTVESRDGGAQVDVKFPLEVVDALFSGSEEELDLAAAIRALADYEGSVVTVHDDETRVRVWVDGKNKIE